MSSFWMRIPVLAVYKPSSFNIALTRTAIAASARKALISLDLIYV